MKALENNGRNGVCTEHNMLTLRKFIDSEGNGGPEYSTSKTSCRSS